MMAIRRGGAWLVDLGDLTRAQGDEIGKRRPCAVVVRGVLRAEDITEIVAGIQLVVGAL